MAILPFAAVVSVLLDGRLILSYAHAYVVDGRTYAPLVPYVTGLADRIGYEGKALVIERGGRSVRISLVRSSPDAFDWEYVALAPLLRALGASVVYDARRRIVEVESPAPRAVETPEPFDASAPQAVPRVVFTPTPVAQAPFVWHGPAVPRRTPLPYPEPT